MSSNHKLSIRLMPGGFCVSTGEFVNVAPGADYEQRLEDAILNQKLAGSNEELQCFVETSRMSLSPVALCDEATAEDMFRLTLRNSETDEKILHETSADGAVRISFGMSNALYNFLARTFPYIAFHHPVIEIIDQEAQKAHNGENWMTISASKGTLSIAAFLKNRLQLANCIETIVPQNRAYHVLNTWTKLNLDVLNDTLYIIGDPQEARIIKNAVSKFIKLCV